MNLFESYTSSVCGYGTIARNERTHLKKTLLQIQRLYYGMRQKWHWQQSAGALISVFSHLWPLSAPPEEVNICVPICIQTL